MLTIVKQKTLEDAKKNIKDSIEEIRKQAAILNNAKNKFPDNISIIRSSIDTETGKQSANKLERTMEKITNSIDILNRYANYLNADEINFKITEERDTRIKNTIEKKEGVRINHGLF